MRAPASSTRRRAAGALFVAACLALAACERDAPPPAPTPELGPVVARAIDELSAQLAEERAAAQANAAADVAPDELERRLRGLFAFVLSTGGRERELGVVDLADSPPAATAWLGERALDASAPEAERLLALEILERRGGAADADALLDVAERSDVPVLRASAAWRLGRLDHDGVLPRLVLRLRYETDWEAVLWIGHALASHGIYSGLAAVLTVADGAPSDDLRSRAAAEAELLAGTSDATRPVDARTLVWLWNGSDPEARLPRRERSIAYRLELWRWLARFDEFQLRGVDDCRFLMARLDRVAAEVLAQALYDESAYVRLGAAQCLERMGPRARDAGPALLAHLEDPELGAWMASALGRVGHPPARPALEARLGPAHPLALRVACARALGRLGLAESVPALLDAFETAGPDGPAELLQALAESLVYCGAPDPAVPVLVAALNDARLEPSTSAAALRHHLVRQVQAAVPGAEERLAAWDALGKVQPSGAPGAGDERRVSDPAAARERAALFAAETAPPGR